MKRAYLSLLLLAGCPELGDPKKEVSAIPVHADGNVLCAVRSDGEGGAGCVPTQPLVLDATERAVIEKLRQAYPGATVTIKSVKPIN